MSRPIGPVYKAIRGNMKPDPSWKHTGEIFQGEMVYIEKYMESVKIPRVDREGNEVWIKHPVTGEPIRQVMDMELVPREREFILHDLGNGQTVKNYFFRPDPDEEYRKAALGGGTAARYEERIRALEAKIENDQNDEVEDKPIAAKPRRTRRKPTVVAED